MTSKLIQFGIQIRVDGNKQAVTNLGDVEAATKKIGATAENVAKTVAATQEQLGNTASELASSHRRNVEVLNETEALTKRTGMSAKQTAAALRGVPAQMTDIFTSLASGQAPMTVLLQQGGQLKDMFGGIGPAVRAVGGYVLRLINPLTLATGAAVGLALAYNQGSREGDEYRKVIVMTGNAAGVSVGQLNAMAESIDRVTGTQSAAAAALAEMVSTGRVAAANLERFTTVALKMESAVGKAVSDTVKEFAELGKAPVEASLKLNEQYRYLTAAVYDQIRALRDQGREEEAAALAQSTYADAMAARATRITESLGLIERAWKAVKNAGKEALDEVLSIGRDQTAEQQMAVLDARIESVRAQIAQHGENTRAGLGSTQTLGQVLQALTDEKALRQETIHLIDRAAEAEAERVRAEQAGIRFSQVLYEGQSKQKKMEAEIAKVRADGVAAGRSELDIQKAIAIVREKYQPKAAQHGESELANMRARIQAEQQYLAQLQEHGAAAAKLNEGEQLALRYSEQLKAATDERTRARLQEQLAQAETLAGILREIDATEELNKAHEEFRKQREKDAAAVEAQINAINAKAQVLEDEVATYGRSKAALEELAIARLEEKRAALLQFEGSDEAIAQLGREIEARKRLAAAISSHESQEENAKAATKAAEEWKRSFDDVSRSLTDAIMRGGKSAGEYLKDYFRTLVLRPVVQTIMSPVAGAVASVFSPSAAASAIGGSGTSPLNMLTAGKALWDGFSGAASAGLGGLVSMAGNMFGSSAVSAFGAGMGMTSAQAAAAASAYNAAGMSGVANSIGYGQMAGVAGTWLGGIGAGIGLGNMISGKYGSSITPVVGTVSGAALGAQIGSIGGPLGAIIGGAIGGVLNRAFGRGPKEVKSFGIEGEFSDLGFNGNSYQNWVQKGGWFRSDKRGTTREGLDIELRDYLSSSFEAIKTSAAGFAEALGLEADKLDDYAKSIKLKLTKDEEENKTLIAELLIDVTNDIVKEVAPGIEKFGKTGETASDTLQRLSSSLVGANSWLSMLRQRLFQVSLAGGDAASKLADAFGGMENLSQASATFYQLYYSESERAEDSARQMADALDAVNIAMPRTMDELRNIAASLDLNTESGRIAYATLLAIAPQFAATAETTARMAQETAERLIETFTGRGQLIPALDAASIGTQAFASNMEQTGTIAGAISRIFMDAGSGLIYFTDAGAAISPTLTGAQLAAALLNDQIDNLRLSANDTIVDVAGLATALQDVDTSTFVSTMELVFKNLAERIAGVINSIGNERIAVREAALQIIDPTVMSKSTIARQIADINTDLPSNAALLSTQSKLAAADAALKQKRADEAQKLAAIGVAQDAANKLAAADAARVASRETSLINLYNSRADIRRLTKYDSSKLLDGSIAPGTYVPERFNVDNGQLTQKLADRLTALETAREQMASNAAASAAKIAAAQAAFEKAQAATVAAQKAADTAAKNAGAAQLAYADALQDFAIDAGKSVDKLSRLREETLRYYETQKQLADLMNTTASTLRGTVDSYRYSQLSAEQQFEQLQEQYATAYAMALSTDGETLAGYGDQLNNLLNPLLEKAREVYGTDLEYTRFAATALARAETVAERLETLAPAGYEEDSLELLGQIDATLAELDDSTRSAERLIVDAINASRDRTAAGLQQVVNALTGKSVAAFAAGGHHTGGLRLVGENGPELEATGPARIWNASQTAAFMRGAAGGDPTAVIRALHAELALLRREMTNLRAESRATAANTGATARLLGRIEQDGMYVRNDHDEPLHVESVENV